MSRRSYLLTTIAMFSGTLFSLADRAAAESRPNFVIIMADDLGYGDLSSYGGWIKTPHLDALASEGLRLTDFHSSGNVCSPTRAGLMTGRYQQRAGIPGVVFADPKRDVHYHGLQTTELTFAESLQAAGYETAIFGKWHLGYFRKYNPIHHGFGEFRGYVSGNVDFFSHVDQAGVYDWWHQDKLVEEPGYTTHLITKHAVRFIEQNKSKPFCLYLPHEAPHYPYQGPEDKAERKVGKVIRTEGSRADIRTAYRQMVQEMDTGVGEIVATLRRLKLEQNTFVFFFSDNGANRNGSNGKLRGAKGSDWEGGHRVPAIAWWPGHIKPSTTSDQLAITLDVMPTLLDFAGVALPKDHVLDGVSLSQLLLKQKPIGDRQLVWNGNAIRDANWKLVRRQKKTKGGPFLFNLSDNLAESNNLAEQFPDRVKKLTALLDVWTQDMNRTATKQPERPETQP